MFKENQKPELAEPAPQNRGKTERQEPNYLPDDEMAKLVILRKKRDEFGVQGQDLADLTSLETKLKEERDKRSGAKHDREQGFSQKASEELAKSGHLPLARMLEEDSKNRRQSL